MIFPHPFILALFCLPAFQGNENGPERETYDRYRGLLVRYASDLEAAEGRYRSELVGKPRDPVGKVVEEGVLLYTLRNCRSQLATCLSELDAARKNLNDRTISLADFFAKANIALEFAARSTSTAALDETKWHVQILAQDFHDQAYTNDLAFGKKHDEILAKFGGENDAATALARKEAEGRERALIQTALGQYRTLTEGLVARRRTLAGDLWRLVDYHERREEKGDATRFRLLVYRTHAYELRTIWTTGESSLLDYFLVFPGSPDRLVLYKFFCQDVESLHKMDAAVRAEPVELLRQYDTTLPALNFTGSEMEQSAKLLSARLSRFYGVEAAQQGEVVRLKGLLAEADKLPLKTPDLAAFPEALQAFRGEFGAEQELDAKRAELEKAQFDAKGAYVQAEAALKAARQNLWMDERFQVVDSRVNSAEKATARRERLEKQLAEYRALVDDEKVDETQRKNLREATIPRLEGNLKKLSDAEILACKEKQAAYDDAVARIAQAGKALAALPPKKEKGGSAEKWSDVLLLYDRVREALPEDSRKGLKDLPAKGSFAAAAEAGRAVETLKALIAQIEQKLRTLDAGLNEAYGEICRAESELGLLAQSVAALRMAALRAAENGVRLLGAKPEDEVIKQIGELRERVEFSEKILSKTEYVKGALGGGDETAAMSQICENVETVARTLKYIGCTLETQKMIEEMRSAGTTLGGFSTMLKLAAKAGKSIPVMGSTFGRFLGFYAEAAGACGVAVVRIQDKLIRRDLEVFFTQPPPERHLYTEAEVKANSSLQEEEANKRLAAMLQVRRLIYLVKASSLTDAKEMTR